MTRIRSAHPGEAAAISTLAIRSKAHWRYTAEQLAVFRQELTITPEQIERDGAEVLERDGEILAFYTLAPFEGPDTLELGHLFVDPDHLGRGLGRQLLEHACRVARARGFAELFVQSDPNAEGFYRASGAKHVRDVPTSIPGRTLPLLVLDLGAD